MNNGEISVLATFTDAADYRRQRAAMLDGVLWPRKFDQWQRAARSAIAVASRHGKKVELVEVPLAGFRKWCEERGFDMTVDARQRYAAHLYAARRQNKTGGHPPRLTPDWQDAVAREFERNGV